jgi:hypothetical protein
MSEKKKKKLVEFKIVKSSECLTPKDSKSASPNIIITKNSPDKKKSKILKINMFHCSPMTKEEVKF